MTATMRPTPSACPACSAAPAAEALAALDAPQEARIALSVPAVHCAACISTVEKALADVPGVQSARVNLTLKRAQIEAAPDVMPDDLIKVLERVGYEAHELDAGALSATQTDKAGRDLLMRLAVAGFASMNVMLLSVSVWAGAEDATRDMEQMHGNTYEHGLSLPCCAGAARYRAPACIFWDPMHTIWANGGIGQYDINQFLREAFKLNNEMIAGMFFLVAVTRLYTLLCRSVHPLVRNVFELQAVFALLLLPNCPRL